MVEGEELEAIARRVIDSNRFMTIGTADEEGVPWVSPVWYAHAGYREFYRVLSPEARHSQNIAARSETCVVTFDSCAPVGEGQAVYVAAVAGEVDDADLDRCVGIFSRVSVAQGALERTREEVRPPAPRRLYRARVSDHWVLDPSGHPVHGRAFDHRARVAL
jgi:Pyridoxamine 5'-phosphate oxidase